MITAYVMKELEQVSTEQYFKGFDFATIKLFSTSMCGFKQRCEIYTQM